MHKNKATPHGVAEESKARNTKTQGLHCSPLMLMTKIESPNKPNFYMNSTPNIGADKISKDPIVSWFLAF